MAERLYRARVQLIAVLLVLGGIGLTWLGHQDDMPAWVRSWPIDEYGRALVEIGGVAVIFELIVRTLNESKLLELIVKAFEVWWSRHASAQALASSPMGEDIAVAKLADFYGGNQVIAQGFYDTA